MTIEELRHITETVLTVNYFHHDRKFTAYLAGVEVVGDGVLTGAYGSGDTPDNAIADYTKEIAGKRIATDTRMNTRREFNVPATLRA